MFKKTWRMLLVVVILLAGLGFQGKDTSAENVVVCDEYSAFINQYGTGDPSVTVITDTLGSTLTWGRNSKGFYSLWSTRTLAIEHTLILVSGARGFIRTVRDPNEISFYTWNPANMLADEIINNTWLLVRVCE